MQDIVMFEFDCLPDDMPAEREAKIFEAGEYPDKGITVSEEDLDTIVGNFREAPVKVEHTDSPLDPLGIVKRVWRQGRELFARLAFPPDLAAFLERRGIRKLSVALIRDPLSLAEVSLVLSPRVPDAAMFGDEQLPEGGMPETRHRTHNTIAKREEVTESMSDEQSKTSTNDTDQDKEIAELKFALRSRDVETKIGELKSQGKIVPASEAFAREILLNGDRTVTFSETETTVADLFVRFLDAQPKVIEFSELVPADGKPSVDLAPEDRELLSKLGVTPEQAERYGR